MFSVTPKNINFLIFTKICKVFALLFYNSILLNDFHKLLKCYEKRALWAYVILEEDFLREINKNYTKNMRDHTRY